MWHTILKKVMDVTRLWGGFLYTGAFPFHPGHLELLLFPEPFHPLLPQLDVKCHLQEFLCKSFVFHIKICNPSGIYLDI